MKNNNHSAKLRNFVCIICGTDFQSRISPSAIKLGRGKVCNIKCKGVLNSINKKKGEYRNCIKCGKEFYVKPSEDRRGYVRQYCKLSCYRNIGSKCISKDGYYIVNTPYGQMKEHRWVMTQHLGRRLLSSEIVHHRDENKLNNSLSNLDLTNRSDHNTHHFKRYNDGLTGIQRFRLRKKMEKKLNK